MLRRLALLIPIAAMLTLNGCIILPGHHDHCCWRYAAVEQPMVR